MRIGELCPLKWRDLDKETKQISITKTLADSGKTTEMNVGTPKTKSSKRRISITSSVISIFDAQSYWQKQYKMSVRKTYYEKASLCLLTPKRFLAIKYQASECVTQ